MNEIASTPTPPYYAVIFTSLKTAVAERMLELAAEQAGFLGAESARDGDGGAGTCGITLSYWKSLEAIAAWQQHSEHLLAQQRGRDLWYSNYVTRIARVERDYQFTVGNKA